MSLADTLKNVTGPLVTKLAGELGSRVTVRYKGSTARALDNSITKTWATRATDVPIILEELSNKKAQELWGERTDVTVQGLMPYPAYAIVGGDGIIVTSGHLTGSRYTVEDVKRDTLGQNFVLALVEARDAF